MEEVKGVPSFSGPKWELQEYYKEYMEDFNTATLPHIKYYNYDKWETEEYEKNKEQGQCPVHRQSIQVSPFLSSAHWGDNY